MTMVVFGCLTIFDKLIFFYVNISVAPRITLSFGANIDHTKIVEGNDVYFECHIEANPAVYKVEWKKDVRADFFLFSPKVQMSLISDI